MSETELRGKFMDCARQALPAAQATALFEQLWQLRAVDDMNSMKSLFGRQNCN